MTSQKSRLLAAVLITSGYPQATLQDQAGRGQVISIIQTCLESDNPEVLFRLGKTIGSLLTCFCVVVSHCPSMRS